MKRLVLIVGALALVAAEPAGFMHWSSAEMKGRGAKLAPKMDAKKKIANEFLGKFGNHSLLLTHREGNGEAEVHEGQVDVFIVQEGTATLVHGGQVLEPRTTAPGEIRGPSIKGGEKTKLAPGDVVNIPVKVPHQLLLAPGAKFTYVIVKIDDK
jgi:mannose-6-phosphate isomerase-like protein (cupin superfamily)